MDGTGTAWRTHVSKVDDARNSVGACLIALVLASCAPAPASSVATSSSAVSAIPSGTPAATSSAAPTPSAPDPSPSPSAAALVIPDIVVGEYLEVTGNGLAVRAGPGADHALVSEYSISREDPIEVTKLKDEVRLPAGHVVQARLGPIVVDDTVWWAVDNVPQAGQAIGDAPVWRSVAPVAYSELDFQLTWIAVAQPGTTLIRTTERPAMECPCYGEPPGPTVVAAGVGEGRVGPWTNRALAFITLAAAAPESGGVCDFRVTVPSGEIMHDQPGADYFSAFMPGVTAFGVAPADAEVWLDVTGDCAWAVTVALAQG